MPTIITKRGKKRWRANVAVNGQLRQKLLPDDSSRSYKEAVAWELKAKEELLQQQQTTDTASLTILDWANDYLDASAEKYARSTYSEKIAVFKKLIRFFGADMEVTSLTLPRCMEFLRAQNREKNGNAANKVRKNLSAGWEYAKKYQERFPKEMVNPFQQVPKFAEQRKGRYIPPEKDFWKVYQCAEGQDQVMLLTFLYLAGRRGEIFRLKWEDVDFENGRARLWTRKRNGGNLEPDWVPMIPQLAKTLNEWNQNRPIKESSYVFVSLDTSAFALPYYGKPFTVRQKFMQRLCEKAGVKHFGFHAIRHLAASIVYGQGGDVSTIQGLLRHQAPTTTNRYIHSLGMEGLRDGLQRAFDRPPTDGNPEGPKSVLPSNVIPLKKRTHLRTYKKALVSKDVSTAAYQQRFSITT